MSRAADWSALLPEVARRLLGKPPRIEAGGDTWRYGAHGSLAVHVGGARAGSWHDFEAGAGGGTLALVEREVGDRAAALRWLADSGLIETPSPRSPPRHLKNAPSRAAHGALGADLVSQHPPRESKGGTTVTATAAAAARLWAAAILIPADPAHPARRWAGCRQLWPPGCAWPAAVRWLDRRHLHTHHAGAGALVVLRAPPEAWREGTVLPDPATAVVDLVHVDADGSPALDRPATTGGLGKRTYGRGGGVALLGVLGVSGAVNVAEGLADALAVASRHPDPAVCVGGTGGLQAPALAAWLARLPGGARVYADPDPAGRRAGALLVARVQRAGGRAVLVDLPADPADTAASLPAAELDPDGWGERAAIVEHEGGLPQWEAERLAAVYASRQRQSDGAGSLPQRRQAT